MARRPKEMIVIVLDIGSYASEDMYDKTASVFDKARACVSMMLQQKIVDITNKDLLSLFLVGSENTTNSLDYVNIELQFPMSTVSWEMVQCLEEDILPTKINGDWLDAIVVGIDYIKHEVDSLPASSQKNISAKKLIVLSNFKAPVSDDQVDLIVSGLNSLDIRLMVIGLNPEPGIDKLAKYESDHSLLRGIVKDVGGVMYSFAEALLMLQCFPVAAIKPMPWNVVMTIGPDVNIAVSSFKMIGNVPLPSMKELVADNKVDAEGRENWVVKETTYMKQDAEQTFVPSTDIIKGFRFGSTIVPFSKIDLESLKYNPGPKCLSILGFTKEKYISVHHLVGDSTHHVMARRNDSNAAVAMSALIIALHQEKMVAVARKVYRDNTTVHIGVLIPRLYPSEVLLFIELPFSDDIRQFIFPSLSSEKPTEKQLQCIDDLLDSMMPEVKDELGNCVPEFQPLQIMDPYRQHFYHSVCYRALHPDGPLPPPQQYILDSLVSPYRDNPDTIQALNRIKENFSFVQVKSKRPRKTAAETFVQEGAEDESKIKSEAEPPLATTMAKITSTSVVQIGTVDPVSDFNTLIEKGHPLATVGAEMGEVAVNLVLRSFGSDDFPKASAAVQRLREECIARNQPGLYNKYVAGLKERVLARGKKLFWDEMGRARLGFITSDECTASDVDPAAATAFLLIKDEAAEEEENPDQGMDVEDLLNEM